MATTLKFRRFTTAELEALTGAEGELFVDLDKDVVVVNDGSTAGGHALQSELVSGTNIKTVNGISILGSGNIDIDSDITAAVNNLIAGAPAALDTLNELALALGDDSDAIVALTSTVATKLTEAQVVTLIDSDYVGARSAPGVFTKTGSNITEVGDTIGGTNNFVIGTGAGNASYNGANSVFIGVCAGNARTSGNGNISIGAQTGWVATSGQYNTVIGDVAGVSLSTGTYNTFLGKRAGYGVTTGSNNLMLGCNAYASGNVSNTIVLGNANISSLIIPGLQSGATDGDVLTYCSANGNLVLAAAGGGGGTVIDNTTNLLSFNSWPASGGGGMNINASCNIGIGHNTFLGNPTGDKNIAIGKNAGGLGGCVSNTIFIGEYAGRSVSNSGGGQTGWDNIGIGTFAGCCMCSSKNNIAIGRNAGANLGCGHHCNVIIGYGAASNWTNGGVYCSNTLSTFIGNEAGRYMSIGCSNIVIGCGASRGSNFECRAGQYNVILGHRALACGACGGYANNNVFIGTCAGGAFGGNKSSVVIGCAAGCGLRVSPNADFSTKNVLIGHRAGYCLEFGKNNVFIGTDQSFGSASSSDTVSLGNSQTLTAVIQVAWTVASDCRDKIIHCNLDKGRGFLQNITPIVYSFKDRETNEAREEKIRYGFSAQDILAAEGDNPVIVSDENPEHLKVTHEHLIPILVNAVNELSAEIETLKERLSALEG